MDDNPALNLLMVHADDHQPILDDGLEDEASQKHEREGQTLPEHYWDEGGDPNALDLQRWGVIAPEGERGDKLLALIEPLIKARQQQQGGDEVLVLRSPAKLSGPEAARWKKQVFQRAAAPEDLPRYQLVLGDLHEVPLALQKSQANDGFVGRLAFDNDEDYESYVDKVLRWEKQPTDFDKGSCVFHTVHDGTAATNVGYRALVKPGLKFVRERHERGRFIAEEIVESGDRWDPSPDELLEAAQTDRPGVMFSLSHGDGPPRGGWESHDHRLARQGAMSFGREGSLEGSDLRNATFLPGGVWFMLACFGAGTPGASAYHHWLEELRKVGQFRGKAETLLAGLPDDGDQPFIAQVPKAVLANPNGPLAFMGHIDLAWTYSFQELDSGVVNRPSKFTGILRSALNRDRVGIAFRELYKFLNQTESELAALYDEEASAGVSAGAAYEADVARRGHLWMLRQDLSAYILLGDPAAHLPIQNPRAPKQKKASSSAGLFGFGAPAAAPAAAEDAAELPLEDHDELEEAIAKYILGEDSPKALAKEYGVDRKELKELSEKYQAAGRAALGMEEA